MPCARADARHVSAVGAPCYALSDGYAQHAVLRYFDVFHHAATHTPAVTRGARRYHAAAATFIHAIIFACLRHLQLMLA